VRRHLERTEFDQAKPTGAALRRIELVDTELRTMRIARHVGEEIAEQSIHQPRRRLLHWRDVRECDLQFRQAVLPRFVDARMLTGWPDEKPTEQVRQARMVVPEAQQ